MTPAPMLLASAYFTLLARGARDLSTFAPLPDVGRRPRHTLNERATPEGLCASCGGELAAEDAAETEGGQRVHANGCPCDEPRRARRKPRAAKPDPFIAPPPGWGDPRACPEMRGEEEA